MKTRVAIIGTVGLPAQYGGFETLAAQLVAHLGEELDIVVYCSGTSFPKEARSSHYGKARLHYLPLPANGAASVLYDTWSLLHAAFRADVLLVLGVAGAWCFPLIRYFSRAKIIVSIDGIEWRRAKWNLPAKLFLAWSEKMAVRHAHIDISDNEAIQDYTAQRYGCLSRMVEYGADHVQSGTPTQADKARFPFLRDAYAIKVCRIEPENNVEMVLEAFAKLPRHKLVLIGNWNASAFGRNLRLRYGNLSHIYLLDPIYDQQMLDILRSHAQVYIHGHSAGGTNPSLIEAMCHGLPVIAYGVSYNRSTTEGKALYFDNAASLEALIRQTPLASLYAQRATMREIAVRRYTWRRIAAHYQALIAEVSGAGGRTDLHPDLARLDRRQLQGWGLAHIQHGLHFYETK